MILRIMVVGFLFESMKCVEYYGNNGYLTGNSIYYSPIYANINGNVNNVKGFQAVSTGATQVDPYYGGNIYSPEYSYYYTPIYANINGNANNVGGYQIISPGINVYLFRHKIK